MSSKLLQVNVQVSLEGHELFVDDTFDHFLFKAINFDLAIQIV